MSGSNDRPSTPAIDQSYRDRLRELELELEKTRSEADAARLDARAADLELRIQRLGSRVDEGQDAPLSPRGSRSREPRQAQIFKRSTEPTAQAVPTEQTPREESSNADIQSAVLSTPSKSVVSPALPRLQSWADVRRLLQNTAARNEPAHGKQPSTKQPSTKQPSTEDVGGEDSGRAVSLPAKSLPAKSAALGLDLATGPPREADRPREHVDTEIELSTESTEPAREHRRGGAWMLSALFHGLLVLLLALFTLSTNPPGDQIAIAGSVAETNELAVESLQIETQELETSPVEPTPSETVPELVEVGELPVIDLISDAPPKPPSPMLDSLSTQNASSALQVSMKSDSEVTMEFCGVQGGGNHFVYLVDSSGSMGAAFESAREELLRSINVLKPEQRFYVIFFDAESDYMRLSSPQRDEPRSVYATAENKQSLRRWAMTISMDRGRAPYDALPFALDLSPDVIFLLSDGEFPQKIEDLLKEINRVDNLFGDEDPISIVHTIGYHSREGESRMRRIAQQNGGQYRHVPKPK